MNTGFIDTARREVRRMCSRKMYFAGMILVPVLMTFFFLDLMEEGLPLKVPTAVVDLDHSTMSRSITRSLSATELIDISEDAESYEEAMALVRSGKIYGFFVIPADFERDVVAGRRPTLSYFNNLTYFVPGSLTFKGFTTIAVGTTGNVIRQMIESAGLPVDAAPLIQPVEVQDHPMGNPWLNYSIYLSPTFLICLLALMIYLMTVFAITMEIKQGTSPEWLATAKGRIGVAVAGKLLPHLVVWSVVAQGVAAVLWGWCHFPCGSLWWMAVGMELFVVACLGFALMVTCVLPNPRLAFICCALVGILSFSFCGLSFPVEQMYGAIGIFSYLVPARYMILIYFAVGLDSLPVYYARYFYVAFFGFMLAGTLGLGRLRRACLNPVYVP
ncbi:MAG: ABC transporter permease [Bacteroides sp.]|nr:ABC transporter permease [Bacteroides sp.]